MGKKDKEFILVDVREPGEVAAGVIPAIEFKAIPRGMLAPKVGKALALKPTDTVVLYCKLGMRSALAAKELQDAFGYKNVYYLKGASPSGSKRGIGSTTRWANSSSRSDPSFSRVVHRLGISLTNIKHFTLPDILL